MLTGQKMKNSSAAGFTQCSLHKQCSQNVNMYQTRPLLIWNKAETNMIQQLPLLTGVSPAFSSSSAFFFFNDNFGLALLNLPTSRIKIKLPTHQIVPAS